MTVIDPTIELITHPDFELVAFDLYNDIHKGIRTELFALCGSAGSTDPEDVAGWAAVVDHARYVGSVLEMHAQHEDTVIEPVLEQFAPRDAERIVADHHMLDSGFTSVIDQASGTLQVDGDERRRLAHLTYLDLGVFTSRYLAHQDFEERVVMPSLERTIGVDAVLGLHQTIVSSIPPEEMGRSLAFMLPAMNAHDRVGLLGGMRMGAPAEVFEGVLGLARSVLEPSDFTVLARGLGL